MQTFLPYPDFVRSANCLDNRCLGTQRVEVLQLLNVLTFGTKTLFNITGRRYVRDITGADLSEKYDSPWHNHPVVKMWRGYENELIVYGLSICYEWVSRGYKDTCSDKISDKIESFWDYYDNQDQPPWIGNEDFHAAHRSNLLCKDPVHYGQFGWAELNNLPHIWPEIRS